MKSSVKAPYTPADMPSRALGRQSAATYGGWLALFAAYVASSYLSSALYTPPAAFPITAAVALTGLVLWGRNLFPLIFVAAAVSYFLSGFTPLVGLGLAAGNTLQAYVGASVLRAVQFDPLMRRTRDVLWIMLVALGAGTIVPSVIWVVFRVNVAFGGAGLPISWPEYWTGDVWALLIIAPFLIRWLAKPLSGRPRAEVAEAVLVVAALCGVDYLLGWTQFTSFGGVSFVYLILVPLLWLAIRSGVRFLTLGLVLSSVILLAGVHLGPSAHLGTISQGERLFQMEVFLLVLAAIHYVVVALSEERRYAALALRAQVQRLEDALLRISFEDSAKSDFLAVLAHELRNPLAPIVSGLELLKMRSDLAPDTINIIDLMDSRADMMRRLLDDLLDITRYSQKKLVLKTVPIDLREIVRRSVRAVNELQIEKTHAYTLNLPKERVPIQADEVRVEQIIVNILKNAVKYTEPGGRIDIALTSTGENATLRIRDNGIGIAKEVIANVFEPFHQADTERARKGGTGLGIGLWLTKMLVELHGGSIHAFSEGQGKGSEFVISMPIVESRAQETISEPRALGERKKRQVRKVLVVDDNIQAAQGMQRLLEHNGHVASVAYSGIDAIKQSNDTKPDVILLDIGLPDMDGYDVARTLRVAHHFNGRLVALTGFGLEDDREKAYNSGFDHHLTKPVSIKDVEAVLARFSA